VGVAYVSVALLGTCATVWFRTGFDTGIDVDNIGGGDGDDACDVVREELVSQL
jgi:hypothetical protein